MRRRRTALLIAVPALAGLVGVGVFATNLQLTGSRDTRMQSGSDVTLDDVAGCQTSTLSVSELADSSFSTSTGFKAATTGYQLEGLSQDCAGKHVSLAVDLDSNAAGDPAVCAAAPQLGNGSFEQGASPSAQGTESVDTSATPSFIWKNDERNVDVWATGHNGVASQSGQQFIKMAADNSDSTDVIYQDIKTTPGEVMEWSFYQQGVSGAANQGNVKIGSTSNQYSEGSFYSGPGSWVRYSGTYTVPAGQTTTRFVIQVQDYDYWTWWTNPVVQVHQPAGSFIDNVSFTSKACPTPGYQEVVQQPVINSQTMVLLPAGAMPLDSASIQGYSVRITP